MPAGPQCAATYDDQSFAYDSHTAVSPRDLAELTGDESAASILQSVKEQEAQFERLTRELEVERQSVANQLEKCKLGSETASMNSISSTDESFHWHPPPRSAQIDEEESDTDSKVSGSQLVDSCLRVLHERGLMGDIGEEPADYSHENNVSGTSFAAPPSGHEYQQRPAMNGQLGGSYNNMALNHMHSPNPSLQSGGSSVQITQKTITTVTKTMTPQHGSPRGPNNYGYSPLGSHRDAPTPTRFTFNDFETGVPDSSSQSRLHETSGGIDLSGYEQDSLMYRGMDYPDQRGYNGSMVSDPRYPDQSQEGSGYPYTTEPYGDRFDDRQPPVGPDMSYQDDQRRDGDPYYNSGNPQQDSFHGDTYVNDQRQQYSPRFDPYQDGAAPSGKYDDSGRYADDQYGSRTDNSYNARPDNRYGDDHPDGQQFSGDPYRDNQGEGSPRRYPDNPPEEQPYGTQDGRYGDDRYGDQPDGNQFRESPPDGRYRDSPVIGGDPYRGDRYENSPHGYEDGPPEGQQYGAPFQDMPENPYGVNQQPPQGDDRSDRTASPPSDRRVVGPYQASPLMCRPDRPDDPPHQTALLGAPPDRYDPDSIRRSPSMDSRDQRWRNPDLPEVIEFLSHPNNAIKANAAAYLQHLCYMDDSVKAKTGSLGGIPALVELVNNEIPEVQRAACGALRNLSYGRANDDNKRAIKNAGGIAALVRLLRKSTDNDIRELVTGILWNLSSCQDLKKPIIDDGLTVLVNTVVTPHTGLDRGLDDMQPQDVVYWSTVFRNGSGVLRNVSSDGEYARRKLRECEGLVKAILHIVKAAIGKNDIDNKSVENCVCILRNLSYACQEVEDPEYHRKRKQPSRQPTTTESTGCFGPRKKKDAGKGSQKGKPDMAYQNSMLHNNPARAHMELLWHPDVVHIYLPLLSDCTNPETLEAAVGAVQNLAACHWQPSEQIRAAVRKEKGLPIIVELLNLEADRVVNAAAIGLRNLAIDHRNKELIGKYAMKQLVTKLPCEGREPEYPISDDTICAIEATLYEVIKNASEFASSLLAEGGVERLVFIANSKGRYSPKVVKFASSILYTMWQFKELHSEYKKHNLRETHFITKTMAARSVNHGMSPPSSADNTLNRPRMDQSGPTVAGYNENTLPYVNRHAGSPNDAPPMGYVDDHSRPYEQDPYMNRRPQEEMMMNDLTLNSGRSGEIPAGSPDFYSTIGGQPRHDPRQPPDHMQHQDDYRPPGGVPLFSNLPPVGQQQPQPQDDRHEPLYAKVNKHQRPQEHMMLEQPLQEGAGGADSWV